MRLTHMTAHLTHMTDHFPGLEQNIITWWIG